MAGKGPWMCSRCKKRFPDPKPIAHHVRDVHKGIGEAMRAPKPKWQRERDRDGPSMADLAVAAEIDRAMGIHNEDGDWLLP